MTGSGAPAAITPGLACVVLAYTNPIQVHRLIAALDPYPVFLHCDAASSDEVFHQMTAGLPDRVTVMPRRRTAWAGWEAVMAELDGLRAAVASTSESHVAVLSGTDYPLMSTAAITAYLQGIPGCSVTEATPLPKPEWGHGGGFWRLRYRFWPRGRRMIWLPVPRRFPRGVVLSGGSALKLLSREHADAVVQAADRRPDLVRFWRRSWIPDETFVHSLLATPALVPGFESRHVHGHPWVIGWDGNSRKSPPWLTTADLPELRQICDDPPDGVPRIFARKFSVTVDEAVLDEIDRDFRGVPESNRA